MFGSIEDPAKNVEADKAKVFKSFKAFVFSLRSSYVDETPAGWTLEGDENIPKISEIAAKEVDILDMF
jgi:hypothetical protein